MYNGYVHCMCVYTCILSFLSFSISLCYYPISPPPGSTNFTFLYLPFIDPSTYYCPDLNKGYSKFRGLQSDSETQDEVFSFSALPTSLFALKPSIDVSSNGNSNRSSSESGTDKNEMRERVVSSSVAGEVTGKLPVPPPPTHLSLVDVGLPVQIHVGSLKHLPKKEIPLTSSSCANENPLPPTPTSTAVSTGSPLPLPPSLPIKSSDTGLPPSSSLMANQLTKVATTPLSTTSSPSLPIETSPPLDWQTSQPSSCLNGLDKCFSTTKRHSISVPQRRRRGCSSTNVSSQIVTSITSQLRASMKIESPPSLPPPPPPSLPPPNPLLTVTTLPATVLPIAPSPNNIPSHSSLSTTINRTTLSITTTSTTTVPVTSSAPLSVPVGNSIPIPHQQQHTTTAVMTNNNNKLVNNLILDPRTVETALRDKPLPLPPPPTPAVSVVHHNNNNSSPNGATSLHDLFATGKLQAETTEKEIKHAVAAAG